MSTIRFTIKPGGRIEASGDGFAGPVCESRLREFLQSMSPSVEEGSELHEEYHCEAVLEEVTDG